MTIDRMTIVHGMPQFSAAYAICPKKCRRTSVSKQIDVRPTVTEHMHLGRLVIVREDHDARSVDP